MNKVRNEMKRAKGAFSRAIAISLVLAISLACAGTADLDALVTTPAADHACEMAIDAHLRGNLVEAAEWLTVALKNDPDHSQASQMLKTVVNEAKAKGIKLLRPRRVRNENTDYTRRTLVSAGAVR